MKLQYLFSYQAELEKTLKVGRGNFGVRDIFRITGGKVWREDIDGEAEDGKEISGRVLPLGGDFQLTDSNGIFHINVRLVIETHDGVNIFTHYTGIADMTGVLEALKTRGQTDFGEKYFVTRPVLETGHANYQWVNTAVCVAEGRAAAPRTVEYRVYQCVPTANFPV